VAAGAPTAAALADEASADHGSATSIVCRSRYRMLAPALAFYRNAFGHPWIWRTDTDAGSEFIAYVIHMV